MKNELKGICFFSIIFLIIDQVIKIVLSTNLVQNQSIILIKNFFSITLVHNKGAAFSLFQENTILFVMIGILAVIGLFIYLNKTEIIDDLDVFIYSLLIGGILGNLMDRIFYGYVIDYLSFNFGDYYFPIFNFADVCIVLSVIILIARTVREDLWKS